MEQKMQRTCKEFHYETVEFYTIPRASDELLTKLMQFILFDVGKTIDF